MSQILTKMDCKKSQLPKNENFRVRRTLKLAGSKRQVVEIKRLPTLKNPVSKAKSQALSVRSSASIKTDLISSKSTVVDSPVKQEKSRVKDVSNFMEMATAPLSSPPIYVLISKQSSMFKKFRFLNSDFFIGPYKIIKLIKSELYNIEVGLSTSYNTIFPKSVLRQYTNIGYSQEAPRNTYMLKSFAKQSLISAIVGWNPHDKLIAMTFKCCHPLHCVVFELVEAALAIESVSSTLFTQLAIEFNDAWKKMQQNGDLSITSEMLN
ncbi:hypothetical protein CORT_0D04230 [Candida orthopsilosis Co 90-125]|uniref:Uncharacterized protein n=1 Tax=Candida orthopsilosis (strain 90-125) TaxID=1136231 RepID=H8X615_CANO9|nr:hypothetical protein CORT_0D04230 [Candida orthopsilosis Co 90-125]CCG23263.1 hypothetical protein CORT_0D04230 [Candida orthopsilosis Co 90-125]